MIFDFKSVKILRSVVGFFLRHGFLRASGSPRWIFFYKQPEYQLFPFSLLRNRAVL